MTRSNTQATVSTRDHSAERGSCKWDTPEQVSSVHKGDLLASLRAVRGELKNGSTPDFNTPGKYDVAGFLSALDRTRIALDRAETLARQYASQPVTVTPAKVATPKRAVLVPLPTAVPAAIAA